MMTKKHASRGPSKNIAAGPRHGYVKLCWFIFCTTRIYGLWWVCTSNRRGPLRGSSTEIRNRSEIVHKKNARRVDISLQSYVPNNRSLLWAHVQHKTKNMFFFSLIIVKRGFGLKLTSQQLAQSRAPGPFRTASL